MPALTAPVLSEYYVRAKSGRVVMVGAFRFAGYVGLAVDCA